MTDRVCPRHWSRLREGPDDSLLCPAGEHRVRAWLIVDDEGQILAAADRIHGPVVVADEIRLDALRLHLDARPDAVFRAAGRRSRRAGAA